MSNLHFCCILATKLVEASPRQSLLWLLIARFLSSHSSLSKRIHANINLLHRTPATNNLRFYLYSLLLSSTGSLASLKSITDIHDKLSALQINPEISKSIDRITTEFDNSQALKAKLAPVVDQIPRFNTSNLTAAIKQSYTKHLPSSSGPLPFGPFSPPGLPRKNSAAGSSPPGLSLQKEGSSKLQPLGFGSSLGLSAVSIDPLSTSAREERKSSGVTGSSTYPGISPNRLFSNPPGFRTGLPRDVEESTNSTLASSTHSSITDTISPLESLARFNRIDMAKVLNPVIFQLSAREWFEKKEFGKCCEELYKYRRSVGFVPLNVKKSKDDEFSMKMMTVKAGVSLKCFYENLALVNKKLGKARAAEFFDELAAKKN